MKGKISLLAVAVLASGCSSVKTVSTDETNQFISAIQAPGGPLPATKISWLQPENKKEACKIFDETPAAGTVVNERVIWDGSCKDGYAYGLGREFLVRDTGSISSVATYVGGDSRPTYHSGSNYAAQNYAYGEPRRGLSTVANTGNVSTSDNYQQYLLVESNGTKYFRIFSIASGELSIGKVFPSGYAVVGNSASDPASPVNSLIKAMRGNSVVGYAVVRYQNGVIEQKKVEPQGFSVVKLPQSYQTFLNGVFNEVSSKLADAERNANDSYNKVEIYKDRLCSTQKSSFVEPAHYRDICQSNGDMTEVAEKMAILSSARVARFQRTADAQRQQAVQAAQIQAINNQTEAMNSQALTNSLNSLNNSIQQQNQNFQQNILANPTTPNFGVKPTYQTSCYNLGVVVRCNTQ